MVGPLGSTERSDRPWATLRLCVTRRYYIERRGNEAVLYIKRKGTWYPQTNEKNIKNKTQQMQIPRGKKPYVDIAETIRNKR